MATTSTPATQMMGMATSHKTIIGGLIGAGLGAGYAHWKKKGYMWPTIIGAAVVAGATYFFSQKNAPAMVAPASTPAAPTSATPIAAASEFTGMNASGSMKVLSAVEKKALKDAGFTTHKKEKSCFYPKVGLWGPCGYNGGVNPK
jgi:hypothetical protein